MALPPSQISISVSRDPVKLGEKLESLPAKPGVYQFKDADGKVLYVGKAVVLRNRVRQYFQKSRHPDARLESMISKISDAEIIVTDSEVEALILEATLIKQLRPRYNVVLKDDKSYPYIVITNEPYPRVFVTRRIIRDGSKYIGPFTDVKSMRSSLKMIREIFKVRSCNYFIDDEVIRKRKIRVCLDYHIKKCEGPCEGLVSQGKYNAMIHDVHQVLKGKTSELVASLEERMKKASDELRFEEAAEFRDKAGQLSVYNERQKIVDEDRSDRDIVSIAAEGNDACGVIFQVREGKVVGRQHRYLTGVKDASEASVLERLVEHYYLEADDIPREIFAQVELENSSTIEQWLSDKRSGKVGIVVPKKGEKARLVEMCRKNAELLLGELKLQKAKRADLIPNSVVSLQRDLRLSAVPRVIECFDISNIQGTDSVASMVVFVDGRPRKSEYRKFKIRTVQGPDDFASMREVVERRYSRAMEEQERLPDLVIVDGGKGQLSSAVEVLERLGLRGGAGGKGNLPVIGLAKRLEEVFAPGDSEPQSIPRTSSGLRLLQHIRDEAHRFAITYHRTLRASRTLTTELDLIKGIGKKRAKELLEAFGSVQGVKFATQEQLSEIVGEKVSGTIRAYFETDDSGKG